MNKASPIIFLFIAVIVGALALVTTENIIVAGVILVLYLIYFLLFATKMINNYIRKVNRNKECYAFINNYVISLSAKNSFVEAFNSATIGAKGELEKEIAHIKELDPIEKIKYLADYFNQNAYQMFLNLIDNYIENGGDILHMSKLLLIELTKIETNQIEFERKGKGKVFEFVLLWVLTLVILVTIRVALNQFYKHMLSSPIYLIGLVAFFLFALIACHILISGYTNEKLSFKKGK